MLVTKRGQRLSIQPVTAAEWAEVLAMAETPRRRVKGGLRYERRRIARQPA